jgi:hypothetical protein
MREDFMENESLDLEKETNDNDDEIPWQLVRKYLAYLVIFIIGGVVAFIGAILVLFWYVGTSAVGGQGTWTVDQFTIGNVVRWVIFLILFELAIIGIPTVVILGGLALWLWWRKLPQEEKDQFSGRKSRRKDAGGGGGFSILTAIIFLIIIFVQGNWNIPLGALSYSYLVFTWVWACIFTIIPFAIAALVYFAYKIGKTGSA